MMDQIEVGKSIFITGPSFSGKTYLISNLIKEFPSFKVVNFERFFLNGDYLEFHNEIVRLCKNGDNVLAECVHSYYDTDAINAKSIKNMSVLSILCLPTYEQHLANYEFYKKIAGKEKADFRTGGASISRMRDTCRLPKKYSHYNGSNYQEIKKVIKDYVISS